MGRLKLSTKLSSLFNTNVCVIYHSVISVIFIAFYLKCFIEMLIWGVGRRNKYFIKISSSFHIFVTVNFFVLTDRTMSHKLHVFIHTYRYVYNE